MKVRIKIEPLRPDINDPQNHMNVRIHRISAPALELVEACLCTTRQFGENVVQRVSVAALTPLDMERPDGVVTRAPPLAPFILLLCLGTDERRETTANLKRSGIAFTTVSTLALIPPARFLLHGFLSVFESGIVFCANSNAFSALLLPLLFTRT